MKYLSAVLLLLFMHSSYARDYYYGTALDGEKKEFNGTADMHSKFISTVRKNKAYWEGLLAKMERLIKELEEKILVTGDKIKKNNIQDDLYKLINNKAHCLILLNREDEALEILKDLEKKLPGESKFAENLAFCYEKKKDYDRALHWIQIAMNRDSMSAYSNIWVYEKILIARQKLSKDPKYLSENRITDIDIPMDKELLPLNFSDRDSYHIRWKLANKAKHIRERIQLQMQRNPMSGDPVIACLTEELATIYAICSVCEVALPVFELAANGHPIPELVQSRIDQMKRLIASNPRSMDYSRSIFEKISKSAWVIGVSFGLLILLIGYLWWKDRKPKAV